MRYWLGICCSTFLAGCGSGQLERPCAGVDCGAPPPPVEVIIAPNAPSRTSFYDATLANVQRPPGTSLAPPEFMCTGPDTPTSLRKCYIYGDVAGVYEADVTARGFQTTHVRVEVPAPDVKPHQCCTGAYVPKSLSVYLSPSD